MKRIVYLCIILLCLMNFAFAQSANAGRTSMKGKKVVKKTAVSLSTEAEKTWIPFWKNFREIVKSRDSQGLYETMPESFEYGFGTYSRKSVMKDLLNNNWWEYFEKITAKGVTNLLRKGAEIVCHVKAKTISKVSPNNWNDIADGEGENSNFLVFEFRENRWLFVAFDFCESE